MVSVRVRAGISFNGVRRGDEATVTRTPRVDGLITAGYFLVVDDGAQSAGEQLLDELPPLDEPAEGGDDGESAPEHG